MRARVIFGALVVFGASAIAMSVTVRAETIRFNAQLTDDLDTPAKPGAGKGRAQLSLDTASKVASWTIEYSGLVQPPKRIACGADVPGGPSILLTSNLASPITGSKALTDAEITTLTTGRWVCVVGGEGDEAEIGGELRQVR